MRKSWTTLKPFAIFDPRKSIAQTKTPRRLEFTTGFEKRAVTSLRRLIFEVDSIMATVMSVRKQPQGKLLLGLAVSAYKFQGVSTLNQLEDYGLLRPSVAEKAAKGTNGKITAAHALREDVNRSFDKQRRIRAENYSAYIENVEVNGHPGGTPAITLFNESQLPITDDGILIPYSAVLAAIDGETQTEARYILRQRLPETGEQAVAITMYHGVSEAFARQVLHDYNAYGKRIDEKQLAAFNQSGALTRSIFEACKAIGIIASDSINMKGAKARKGQVASLRQLLAFAAGFQRNGLALTSVVSAAQMAQLNAVSVAELLPAGLSGMKDSILRAANDAQVRNAKEIVWQVAGALVAANRSASSLNWASAVGAYNSTTQQGRGGARMAIKDRLAAIAAAF